jgi:hypothetical protein
MEKQFNNQVKEEYRRIEKHDDQQPQYPDRRLWERLPEEHPENTGKRHTSPESGKWSKELMAWLKQREAERQRERDGFGRNNRKLRMPRPYLNSTSNFGPDIVSLKVGEPGTAAFTVWNEGNFPAWTCYVELYEGPGGYTHPLSDYTLRGREIITLHPGERRDVTLPWLREQRTGRIVGLVYDPLLDPIDFTMVEQYNRHITSVHYVDLE